MDAMRVMANLSAKRWEERHKKTAEIAKQRSEEKKRKDKKKKK